MEALAWLKSWSLKHGLPRTGCTGKQHFPILSLCVHKCQHKLDFATLRLMRLWTFWCRPGKDVVKTLHDFGPKPRKPLSTSWVPPTVPLALMCWADYTAASTLGWLHFQKPALGRSSIHSIKLFGSVWFQRCLTWLSLVSRALSLWICFFLGSLPTKIDSSWQTRLFHLIGKLGHRVSCTVKGLAYGRLSLTKIFKG